MLRLIREENLSRFSSVVRAADTWFGILWDGSSAVKIDSILDRVSLFLDDPRARRAALDESDAETVYLALWSTAFDDVAEAIGPAKSLLGAASAELRFVATHFLAQTLWTPRFLRSSTCSPIRICVSPRARWTRSRPVLRRRSTARVFEQLEGCSRACRGDQDRCADRVAVDGRTLERPMIAAALRQMPIDRRRALPSVCAKPSAARSRDVRSASIRARTSQIDSEGIRAAHAHAGRARCRARVDGRRLRGRSCRGVRGDEDDAGCPTKSTGSSTISDANPAICETRASREFVRCRTWTFLGRRSSARRRGTAEASRGVELLRDASERTATPCEPDSVWNATSLNTAMSPKTNRRTSAVLGERQPMPTTEDALGSSIGPLRADGPKSRTIRLDTPGARGSIDALARLVLEHASTEFGRRRANQTPRGVTLRDVWSTGSKSWRQLPTFRWWTYGALGGRGRRRSETATGSSSYERSSQNVHHRSGSRTTYGKSSRSVDGARETFLRGLLAWCLAWNPPPGARVLVDGLETDLAELTDRDYAAMTKEGTERGRCSTAMPAKSTSHTCSRWPR